ncbi:hypothetical protein HDU91_006400, partial [Kappamyces sp. JEL0680]
CWTTSCWRCNDCSGSRTRKPDWPQAREEKKRKRESGTRTRTCPPGKRLCKARYSTSTILMPRRRPLPLPTMLLASQQAILPHRPRRATVLSGMCCLASRVCCWRSFHLFCTTLSRRCIWISSTRLPKRRTRSTSRLQSVPTLILSTTAMELPRWFRTWCPSATSGRPACKKTQAMSNGWWEGPHPLGCLCWHTFFRRFSTPFWILCRGKALASFRFGLRCRPSSSTISPS